MDPGNVQFVNMNQISNPEPLSTWRLSTCSHRDTLVQSVRSFVPHTMHWNYTNLDTTDNLCQMPSNIIKLKLIIQYKINKQRFSGEEILSKMIKSEGQWSCIVCTFSSLNKHNVLKHVEAKHVSTSGYNCGLCQKFCSSLNALKLHESRYHKKQFYWYSKNRWQLLSNCRRSNMWLLEQVLSELFLP